MYTKATLRRMGKKEVEDIAKAKGLKTKGLLKATLVDAIIYEQNGPRNVSVPVLKSYRKLYGLPSSIVNKGELIESVSAASKEKGHSVHISIENGDLPPLELAGVYGLFDPEPVVKTESNSEPVVKMEPNPEPESELVPIIKSEPEPVIKPTVLIQAQSDSDADSVPGSEPNQDTFLDDDDVDENVNKRAAYYDAVYQKAINEIDRVLETNENARELGEILKVSMKKLSVDQKSLAEMMIRGDVTAESIEAVGQSLSSMDNKNLPVTASNDEKEIVKRIIQRTKTLESDYDKFYEITN